MAGGCRYIVAGSCRVWGYLSKIQSIFLLECPCWVKAAFSLAKWVLLTLSSEEMLQVQGLGSRSLLFGMLWVMVDSVDVSVVVHGVLYIVSRAGMRVGITADPGTKRVSISVKVFVLPQDCSKSTVIKGFSGGKTSWRLAPLIPIEE